MNDHEMKDLSRNPNQKITINPGTDGLTGCYFYPVPILEGIYLLCNEHDETLSLVTNGHSFIFEHDGLIWRIPNPTLLAEPFIITPDFASGSWWNNAGGEMGSEDGTFTAQASGTGTGDDENASYAAAK